MLIHMFKCYLSQCDFSPIYPAFQLLRIYNFTARLP
jgi:hypothetical protein